MAGSIISVKDRKYTQTEFTKRFETIFIFDYCSKRLLLCNDFNLSRIPETKINIIPPTVFINGKIYQNLVKKC